jgi:hypothetical protein
MRPIDDDSPAAGKGALALVALAGIASVELYVVVFFAQRSLSTAGRTTPVMPALATYLLATLALFAAYLLVLRLCRTGKLQAAGVRRLALIAPISFYLVALPVRPSLSIDVLSYISHGAIVVELHQNPYLTPSSAIAQTPLGPALATYGWRPVHPVSPYGPLWTDVEVLAVEILRGPYARLVALKLVTSLASLAAAAAIWAILGRFRPDARLLGTLAYLWNPMIVCEVAADGHNDALMALLVLVALALTVRRPVAGFVATILAALTKYVPLVFLPAQAIYVWRTQPNVRRRARAASVAFGLVVCLAVAAFAPFWAGARTFAGVLTSATATGTASTETIVREALSDLMPGVNLDWPLRVAAAGAFVVFVAVVSRSARDAGSLFRSAAWIGFAYLLASPTYWPWYAVLPVALAAVVPDRPFPLLLIAMSVGARLAAPLDVLFVGGTIGRAEFLLVSWAAGLGIPLLAVCYQAIAARHRPKGLSMARDAETAQERR